MAEYLQEFNLEDMMNDYANFVVEIGQDHFVVGRDFLSQYLEKSHNIIFEGAQGTLLDTEYPYTMVAILKFFDVITFGFFPYVTATCCTPKNAMKVLEEVAGLHCKVTRVGVMRSYLPFITITLPLYCLITRRYSHRHGAGPFVTQSVDIIFTLPFYDLL